jgi:ubiquinone/menaquinone biosynthesis C-methylase UbiE
MVDTVSLVGNERVLDIGTGAGHTALAFSNYVSECLGMDLTDAMVEVATRLADERGISNVKFQVGDA